MERLNLPTYDYELRNQDGRVVILDTIRKRFVTLTPEEWVRQHFVQYMINHLDFPCGLIGIEVSIPIRERHYRADIVGYDRQVVPLLLVECKRPSVKLNQDVFNQIGYYNIGFNVPYLVITNGMEHYCCLINHSDQSYQFLDAIPSYTTMTSSNLT